MASNAGMTLRPELPEEADWETGLFAAVYEPERLSAAPAANEPSSQAAVIRGSGLVTEIARSISCSRFSSSNSLSCNLACSQLLV
jgi:hypothetical protein